MHLIIEAVDALRAGVERTGGKVDVTRAVWNAITETGVIEADVTVVQPLEHIELQLII